MQFTRASINQQYPNSIFRFNSLWGFGEFEKVRERQEKAIQMMPSEKKQRVRKGSGAILWVATRRQRRACYRLRGKGA